LLRKDQWCNNSIEEKISQNRSEKAEKAELGWMEEKV
jgi:hypothetical protein